MHHDERPYDVTIKIKSCSIEKVSDDDLLSKLANNLSLKNTSVIVRSLSGTVVSVGKSVSRFKPNDDVCAVISIRNQLEVSKNICAINESFVVSKPTKLSWQVSTACITDGIKAYNALHYQAALKPNILVLICNAASSFGIFCLQLASLFKCKVMCTVSCDNEEKLLKDIFKEKEVKIYTSHEYMKNAVLAESENVGVDVIIDCEGVAPNKKNATSEESFDCGKPTKHDIISCLGVSGKWVTSSQDLELSSQDSKMLCMKNASVNYQFYDSLIVSMSKQNKVLHVLSEVLQKAESSLLTPYLIESMSIDSFDESTLQEKKSVIINY